MNSVYVTRANYHSEFVYFIPTSGTDWQVGSNGTQTLYDEAGNSIGSEAFSVRLRSQTDSPATLQAFLDNHAVLTVTATKTQIQANGNDSVVWSIVGQTSFAYRLMKNNIVVATGNVNDGSLTFQTDEPDVYLIELKIGNQTGFARVEAL